MGAIHDRIVSEVLVWPGVRLADLPFPKRVRDELIAVGRAQPHHVVPESGWVSRWIRGPEDVEEVVELFRMQYERLAARRERALEHQTRRDGTHAGQA